MECERSVEWRKHHTKGCIAACQQCYRYGIEYPCKPADGEPTLNCADCSFMFQNADCFAFHKLQQRPDARDGRSQRRFKSICEMRRLCRRCHRVVYSREGEHRCGQLQQQQEQQQLQQSWPSKCEECWGIHFPSQPCFIQPVNKKRLNSMLQRFRNGAADADIDCDDDDDGDEDIEVDGGMASESESESLTVSDDAALADGTKPYRFFVFDIECGQEEEAQPGKFRHQPMLICAEMICTECIKVGISIGRNNNNNNINPPRPPTCVCKGAERMRRAMRCHVVPDTDGRCFRFDNFDSPQSSPVDLMLNFLTKRAPSNAITVALSHNGNSLYFYIKLFSNAM